MLFAANGRHHLLHTKQQQTRADENADHRSDDGRFDKNKYSHENEHDTADHLGIVIVDKHGSVCFQTAQVRGDDQAENAQHRDPCSQYIDDESADHKLEKVARDESGTKHQRKDRTDQLIIFSEAQRPSFLPDADPAQCMENHEQSDDPCQCSNGDSRRNDTIDTCASDGDSDD